MKQPMFAIEIDPDKGIRIVIARLDGTQVVLAGGQYRGTLSEAERSYPKLPQHSWPDHPLAP